MSPNWIRLWLILLLVRIIGRRHCTLLRGPLLFLLFVASQ
jgi:hypothetical protein